MTETWSPDERRPGPATLVAPDVTPELLVCTALVRCGLVDGAGASILLGPTDRFGLAATDETFAEVAEMQFSAWEGPGPEVVRDARTVWVDDLHAQGERWPLTTPHATTTRMRALATIPLLAGRGMVGLFAAYRVVPGPFDSADRAQLQAVAAALAVLVGTRFDDADQVLHVPSSPLATAVGIAVAHHRTSPATALALIRARAYRLGVSAPSLAADLVSGAVRVEDLLDRDEPR